MDKDTVIETFTLLQSDKEVKKLFDADISARVPYRLHCCVYDFNREVREEDDLLYHYDLGGNCQTLKILNEFGECLMYYQIRPYLRPMSSMTEKEKQESLEFAWLDDWNRLAAYDNNIVKYIDWLNKHHFDYRGLIEKNLALEAPEGMYEK